jgi:hypothetical protein
LYILLLSHGAIEKQYAIISLNKQRAEIIPSKPKKKIGKKKAAKLEMRNRAKYQEG